MDKQAFDLEDYELTDYEKAAVAKTMETIYKSKSYQFAKTILDFILTNQLTVEELLDGTSIIIHTMKEIVPPNQKVAHGSEKINDNRSRQSPEGRKAHSQAQPDRTHGA